MKELSIEEKASRYDEAIQRLRNAFYDNNSRMCEEYRKAVIKIIEPIFPELKESEDERIREAILWCIRTVELELGCKDVEGLAVAKLKSWLEKQGEKPNNVYNKELSEILGRVIRRYINDPNIPYSEREKVSREIIPYVERLEKQSEQGNNEDEAILHRFSFYSYKDEPNILYLAGLYVNDEYRNKGIGTKILKIADEVAVSMKCSSILLKTEIGSNAERLYKNNGYSVFRREENQVWLEKQGEQKPAEEYNITSIGSKSVQDKLREMIKKPKPIDDVLEQKPADNAEPKFKVGDWVVNNNGEPQVSQVTARSWPDSKIKGIEDNLESFINTATLDKQYHLWTIQDAKDGDVLISEQIAILFKKFEEDSNYNFVIAHAGIDVTGKLQITDGHWLISNYTHPATKEQRDTLIKAMADAGYEWNAEKKELKKIESITTWSEEDEKAINDIMWIIEAYRKNGFNKTHIQMADSSENWLESLKERVQPKQEWSEEDEYCIHQLIVFCENCMVKDDGAKRCAHWLKSLKERYTWKPSKEQIMALRWVLNHIPYDSHKEEISGLLEQLKKLREE